MPEPSPPSAPAAGLPAAAPGLTIRLGPVQGAGRGAMRPEELRGLGIQLNGGRRRGWKKRLALLLATPETTIAAWASRSAGNARPVPGAVAVAARLMADIVRQAMAAGASRHDAAEALAQRVGALCHGRPDWLPAPEPPGPAAEASLAPPPEGSILVEPPRPGG